MAWLQLNFVLTFITVNSRALLQLCHSKDLLTLPLTDLQYCFTSTAPYEIKKTQISVFAYPKVDIWQFLFILLPHCHSFWEPEKQKGKVSARTQ